MISKMNKCVTFICQIILTLLVLSTFVEVVLRYIFKMGIPGSGEYMSYLFLWFSLLGATMAAKDKEHLVVDFLLQIIPGTGKNYFDVLISMIETIFYALLAWFGWKMALMTMNQMSEYFEIPYGIVYLIFPIASVIIVIYTVDKMVKEVKNLALRKSCPAAMRKGDGQ
jgi:TRAP-type C4-dicarboxylate transport system permease small subunit